MGVLCDYYYKYVKGTYKMAARAQKDYGNRSYDEKPVKITYTVNDKKVTKAEYSAYVKKLIKAPYQMPQIGQKPTPTFSYDWRKT